LDTLPIVKGLATYLVRPASRFRSLIAPPAAQGSTWSAPYCYGVWFKHFTLLREQGMPAPLGRVAEFGPGESLGVGIAALLSGARQYGAFDIERYATTRRNLLLLDELAAMFAARAPFEGSGWPSFAHLLDSQRFPSAQIPDEVLRAALRPERVAEIRQALIDLDGGKAGSGPIQYHAPWDRGATSLREPYDLILTHSVMQYVEDLPLFYSVCAEALAPRAWMSHQIDLSSITVTRQWNGHWCYPSWAWKLVRGNRPFFITRHTASDHLAAIRASGFEIVRAIAAHSPGGIARAALAADLASLSDDDLHSSGLFVIARKR